jgi:hypothetical protein
MVSIDSAGECRTERRSHAVVHGRARKAFRRVQPPKMLQKLTRPTWRTQNQYNVRYLKYWVNDQAGKVFCLVDAPDAETANRVHREAHGLVADHIYEVEEGS